LRARPDQGPVKRAGMASGTADLQRDLGGAVMQSVFGALLTAGYAAAVASSIASAPSSVQAQMTSTVVNSLEMSYAGAAEVAAQYPQYSTQIIAAAKTSFLAGADYAYTAGIIAVLAGAALVFFVFPKKEDEEKLLAQYHETDAADAVPSL
jgi:DHA2 family multidrug resistance protein-like MFS transporter